MIKSKTKKYWPLLIAIVLGEIFLILNHFSWRSFFLLPLGALLGYFLLDLPWFSFQPPVKKHLIWILTPLTLFILTSTAGTFGKTLIIFLNLRIILDKWIKKKNNQIKAKL